MLGVFKPSCAWISRVLSALVSIGYFSLIKACLTAWETIFRQFREMGNPPQSVKLDQSY